MMKYPLTPKAQEEARRLVEKWDADQLDQYMVVSSGDADNERVEIASLSARRVLEEIGFPLAGVLFELSKFGLIDVQCTFDSSGHMTRIAILLLEELRNAVANDFEVSDYFLTLNAVGNVIVNSTTGPVQGVGINSGIVRQNIEQVADDLVATLGQEFIRTQVALKDAIDALRTATVADQQSRLGKVISELGRCLQDGANAATVVGALTIAIPFLQKVMGG
jgi:hypothetical protein